MDLDVRPPTWARIYLLVFALVRCKVLGWSLVDGLRGGETEVLVALKLSAVGILFLGRLLRMRAHTNGDELVVRNPLRTRTVRRADIDDVRTGNPEGGSLTFGKMVLVQLHGGSVVALDATLRTGWTASGRRELADTRERLLAWVGSDRSPARAPVLSGSTITDVEAESGASARHVVRLGRPSTGEVRRVGRPVVGHQ